MSHITRGNSNDHKNYDENLLISSSMKEDLQYPRWKDTKLIELGISEVGDEECYCCEEISEEQANILINELNVFNAFVDYIKYDGNFQNFIKDKERTE